MKKGGLPPVAWALAGLLLVAAFLISLGQQDNDANPEVASYGPSGLSAFADLLSNNGIKVVVDQQPKPKLGPNDVAVLFQINRPLAPKVVKLHDEEEDYRSQFLDSVRNGATGVVLPLDVDFLNSSRATAVHDPAHVKDNLTGATYRITTSDTDQGAFENLEEDDDSVGMTLWSEGQSGPSDKNAITDTYTRSAFLRAYKLGKGTVLVARDGIGITNRFIDKNDNVKAFASALKILTKDGKRVVFEEASFGNVHEKGLLETVGAWANAAWEQLIFLGLVIVFTLGKRFGLAEDRRAPQRGARELLDGIADTFKRAKSSKIALEAAWWRADADVRVLLKLPRDATRSERDRMLPVELQNALARLEAASKMEYVPQDDALLLVKKVQKEMDDFLGPHRAKMRSQAKLKA